MPWTPPSDSSVSIKDLAEEANFTDVDSIRVSGDSVWETVVRGATQAEEEIAILGFQSGIPHGLVQNDDAVLSTALLEDAAEQVRENLNR